MNRYTAFLTHLGLSLVIFLVLGYFILYHWYPDFLFTTDGGWQGIRIVAVADFVIGPILTLVVFKAGKPGLKFDLSVIAALQALCLLGGTYVVYSERPLAIVYSDGFFHSMTADDYASAGVDVPELRHFPGSSPKWVSVHLPEDPTLQSEVRRNAMSSDIPLRAMVDYYKPFEPADIDSRRDPIPLERFEDGNSEQLDEFVHTHGGVAEDYLFFPFGARHGFAVIGLNRDDVGVAGVMLLPQPS